jgi:glycosyltransferase involved in cell wall biosynthesis
MRPRDSVLILSLNEEINIPGALDSVAAFDDVVVFDSFSSDRTCDIARAYGARVVKRTFDNYATHRNAALTTVEYRYPWVLMLDADERVPRELAQEIEQVTSTTDSDIAIYRLRRKDMFWGKWIKRSSCYPTWFARLLQPSKSHFIREINEDAVSDGKTGYLREHLIHLPFKKGIAFWLERHNRYSTMEARTLLVDKTKSFSFADMFSRDPVARRSALKQMAYRMPLRPMLVFCYLYFGRLGFFDGRAGLSFCLMRTMYEYMIDIKVRELRRLEKKLEL